MADRSLKNFRMWYRNHRKFDRLVDSFRPDAVVSSPGNFAAAVLRANIPLIIWLRGNYWRSRQQEWLPIICHS